MLAGDGTRYMILRKRFAPRLAASRWYDGRMLSRSGFYPRVFALVVAAVLGYALFLIFAPIALSMAWAAFLAFILYPLNLRMRRHLKGKSLAAGVLTLLAPIIILLPLSAVSVEFVAQISVLLRRVQQYAAELDIKSFSDLQQFPLIARANAWLLAHAGISAEQVQTWLVSGTREVMQRAASVSGSFFLGALGSLLSFVIMLSLLFFFLRDGELLAARARGLIPLAEERKERLFYSAQRRDTRHRFRHGRYRHHARRVDRHRLCDRRPAVADRVRRAGGAVARCCRWAARHSCGYPPCCGCSFPSTGVPAPSCWCGDSSWAASTTYCGRCSFPAGRESLRFGVFLGVLGGIPAFGAIGVIAGPVVLSLVLALIEFAEESRPDLAEKLARS